MSQFFKIKKSLIPDFSDSFPNSFQGSGSGIGIGIWIEKNARSGSVSGSGLNVSGSATLRTCQTYHSFCMDSPTNN